MNLNPPVKVSQSATRRFSATKTGEWWRRTECESGHGSHITLSETEDVEWRQGRADERLSWSYARPLVLEVPDAGGEQHDAVLVAALNRVGVPGRERERREAKEGKSEVDERRRRQAKKASRPSHRGALLVYQLCL